MQENIAPDFLLKLTKPARYTGNEINMVVKDPAAVDLRFLFCFPDVYEVGMSHLGLQILYFMLNAREDTYCERAFAPWADMEQALRQTGRALTSLETATPIHEFDFIGFTLQYELSCTNLINMLELGGVPIFSADRGENDPIVCAGGPCAYNPEPLADIVDFFFIGEGEAGLNEILDKHKSSGTRAEFLESILSVPGVYVPRFYDVEYSEDGTIQSFTPNNPNAPRTVTKAVVWELDKSFYPTAMLVPLIETVHDRVMLEVFRGCMRGCRFCQAGYVYRPMREKEPETLLAQARQLIDSSGHEEISLVSLSTSDYSRFPEFANGLMDEFRGEHVNLSLPSTRVDAFSLGLLDGVRRSSLTFAPEAGTQRMRDVINKNLTREEIIDGCTLAYTGGFNRLKLYYMLGLPTETATDLLGIVELSEAIVEAYYTVKRKSSLTVVVSTSRFVPKPFTPFQWEAQAGYDEFMDKQRLIKKSFRKRQIKYSYHEAGQSVVEGALARGDRRLARVIVRAHALGARFDGWTDHFAFERWQQAFADCGLSMEFFAGRERDPAELLPWDHINPGVTKEFLLRERERAHSGATTPNCREKCAGCGAERSGVCLE